MKPVMLEDDSPTMRASMASMLSQGCQPVEKASSTEDASAKLKSMPPLRAMTTDCHIPGMNGAALMRGMREVHGKTTQAAGPAIELF
jgi:two-component system chemotaxis response regulator CheY